MCKNLQLRLGPESAIADDAKQYGCSKPSGWRTAHNMELKGLCKLQDYLVDLEGPVAGSADARKRLQSIEGSLGVTGLSNNLPSGVRYACSSVAFSKMLEQARGPKASPQTGEDTWCCSL